MRLPRKTTAICPACRRPMVKHLGIYGTCEKLTKARAALKAIRTVSTASSPKIRLEYVSAIAEAGLEMTE